MWDTPHRPRAQVREEDHAPLTKGRMSSEVPKSAGNSIKEGLGASLQPPSAEPFQTQLALSIFSSRPIGESGGKSEKGEGGGQPSSPKLQSPIKRKHMPANGETIFHPCDGVTGLRGGNKTRDERRKGVEKNGSRGDPRGGMLRGSLEQ